jgi:hypothetical protein
LYEVYRTVVIRFDVRRTKTGAEEPMSETRQRRDRESPHGARARRREEALVAQYIHDLSDRHNGNGGTRPAALDRDRAAGGDGREEGG